MSDVFLAIYSFIKKRKFIGILLLLLFFAATIFFSSKLKLEESVSKVFPKSNEISFVNELLQNSKFLDKLIFNIYIEDTTIVEPDSIVTIAQILIDSIQEKYMPEYILSIEGQTDGQEMLQAFDLFYENLPVYIDDADYRKLDSLIEYGFNGVTEKNLKQLMSPVGFATKDFIIKDPLSLATSKLALLRSLQIDENIEIWNNILITKDRKNVMLFMQPTDASNTGKNQPFFDDLDKLIVQLQRQTNLNIQIEYYGSAAVACDNASQIKEDIQITVTIAMVILIFLMYGFFRRKRIFLLIFLPVIMGALVAASYFALFSVGVSAISLGIGSVLLGIAVDFSLHILTHHRHNGNVRQTLKDVTTPILMSSFTTAVAFLCLLKISSEAMQDLGLFAAISVVTAAVGALLLLPHFLPKQAVSKPVKTTIIDRIAGYSFEKNKIFIYILLTASVVFLFFSKDVQFEKDIEKTNFMTERLQKADEHIKMLTDVSMRSVYIMGLGDDLDLALEAAHKSRPKLNRLLQDKTIEGFYGITNLIISKSLQQERIDKWNNYWTTEKKETFKKSLVTSGLKYNFRKEAYTQFFEILDADHVAKPADSLMPNLSFLVDDFVMKIKDQTVVVNLAKVKSDVEKAVVYESFENNKNIHVVDKKYIATKLFTLLKNDFTSLINFSLLIIFLLILLFLGRIELTIVTMLPMLVSWGITLGIMGVFGVNFNVFNVIISTFIFGLGIDYSIFITKGLQNEYIYGKKDLTSYKASILISSLTTVIGIGVLIFAKHPALRSIALLSIIGIVTVVVISFTFQPLLFRFFVYRKAGRKTKHPITFENLLMNIFILTYFFSFGATYLVYILFLYAIPMRIKYKRIAFLYVNRFFCKIMLHINYIVKKEFIGYKKDLFKEPSIIISNHQSMFDMLIIITLAPKVVMVVKDWVWVNPIVGFFVRFMGYLRSSEGYEAAVDQIKQRLDEGYSVVIFPEGTRTKNGSIKRFHKGAFYLAEKLDVPILPMIIHGAFEALPRGGMFFSKGHITVKFLPKIWMSENRYGENYSKQTKAILHNFREEYAGLNEEKQRNGFRKYQLLNNYLYKGPILENYVKIKLRLEKYYNVFEELVPRESKIYDIGCGMGMLDYMLWLNDNKREIIGIDYDEEKILLAQNTPYENKHVTFIHTNAIEYEYECADVFVINDMLHYIPDNDKKKLIEACMAKLNSLGKIIIRDGNLELAEKHEKTKLTEFFSTRLGFNKAQHALTYLSESFLRDIAEQNNMNCEVVSSSKKLSNQIFVLTRK